MDKSEQSIRDFIARNFVLGQRAGALSTEDSLMEAGIMDSTGVLELTGFLEKSFELQITDEELLPENLDTIGRIVAFVARKQGGVE
jgi:acyl carrier protein